MCYNSFERRKMGENVGRMMNFAGGFLWSKIGVPSHVLAETLETLEILCYSRIKIGFENLVHNLDTFILRILRRFVKSRLEVLLPQGVQTGRVI